MANVIGIDVSEHNGALDWAKIKAAGIQFAIIRTGYGTSHTDNYFKANMEGALKQGIPVGIYHFSYALNEAGATNEAAFVIKLLEPYKAKIILPVFFDFEYDTVSYAKKQGVTLGKTAFNAHAVAFLEAVKAAGYTPGVYYNLDYRNSMVDTSKLGSYVQWYAQYSSKASFTGYDLWQYSSSYQISGISGKFDVNTAPASFLGGTNQVIANSATTTMTATVSKNATVAASVKEDYETVKTWKNGSTSEPVYADTTKKIKIGSLNAYESCDCLGKVDGMCIVRYQVDGTSHYKVGVVSYNGGV
jgi:GH25 family lysozyme M1 (1,4-beta-N-acetylmuramidase)